MKLEDLKVGMKVRFHGDSGGSSPVCRVTAVGEKSFMYIREDSDNDEHVEGQLNGWQIVEPKRKPSERIAEIYGQLPKLLDLHAAKIGAIIRYLDEAEDMTDLEVKKILSVSIPVCKHGNGTWFDRTFSISADGKNQCGPNDICNDCGVIVNEDESTPTDPKKEVK